MSKLKPEWEFELNRIRPVADNLVRARWLRSYAVTPKGIVFGWTKLGLKKVRQLSEMWTELTPATFDPNYSSAFWAIILRTATENGMRKSK
jgi:hypothetical protein